MIRLRISRHPINDFNWNLPDIPDACPVAQRNPCGASHPKEQVPADDAIRKGQSKLILVLLQQIENLSEGDKAIDPLVEDFKLELGDRTFSRSDFPIGEKEWQILVVLCRQNDWVSRIALIDEVWGDDGCEESTVTTTVANLRAFLRSMLSVPDVDPIPSSGRGLKLRYRLDKKTLWDRLDLIQI